MEQKQGENVINKHSIIRQSRGKLQEKQEVRHIKNTKQNKRKKKLLVPEYCFLYVI